MLIYILVFKVVIKALQCSFILFNLQRPLTPIKQDHLDIGHDSGVEVLLLLNTRLVINSQIMIDTPVGSVRTNS